MRIITIVGARPQFIKAAVISRAISIHNKNTTKKIEEEIIHTGQHYDQNMSEVFFKEMDIPQPHYSLAVGGMSHGAMTGEMLSKIENILNEKRPDVVLVYGDTNSTLAGALAAAKMNIPVAHVEAGLRSYNQQMPEEINRVLTDNISSFLFCPTDNAVMNLYKEGFKDKKGFLKASFPFIKNVGDVMYDAILYYKSKCKPTPELKELIECNNNDYYLCTIHRAENTDNLGNLNNIFNALNKIAENRRIILPLHPRTRKVLERERVNCSNLTLIHPVGYFDMIKLLEGCKGVFTDSGGLQKEAFFIGKPCITLRNETEWVELVENGYNVLTGANYVSILEAEKMLTNTIIKSTVQIYGNGQAGQKIVSSLADLI